MKNIYLLFERIKACIVLLVCILLSNAKISHAQNVVWANAYSNPSYNLSVKNLRSNSAGENYTVGSFSRTVDFDAGAGVDTIKADIITGSFSSIAAFISKTDNAGNHIWARALIPYSTLAKSVINDIDMDANANIYVAGTFSQTVDFDPGPAVDSLNSSGASGSFIMKLDPTGTLVWVHTFLNGSTKFWDIIIDEDDNLMISGSFSDTIDFDPGPAVNNLISSNTNEVFVLKMNANGNFLWAKSWAGSKPTFRSTIDADDANNIYVSGSISTYQIDLDPNAGVYIDSGQSFVIKLDPSGNFIWGKALINEISMVFASHSNNLYMFGSPDILGNNPYLSEYDSSGTQLWSKMLEDPLVPGQNFAGGITSMTQDLLGNLIMGGKNANKYFIYTTDSLGNMLWVKKSNTSSNLEYLTVKMSPQDEMIITGNLFNVLDVDFGAGIDTVGSTGSYSYFLMKYSYCGNNYTFNYNGCDSVVMADTTYLVAANYLKEFQDINGCDSSVYIHANLNILHDTVMNVCDSAVYYGQVYTQSGIYTQIVANMPGCDSIALVEVNINTPANAPVFMNLIQTIPDPYMGTSIEIDTAYNIYVSGGGGGPIPELGMNNAAYAYVSEYDSAGGLTWHHKMIHSNPSQYLYSNILCLDDVTTLHAGTMYQDVLGYSPNNAGTEEIFLPNNVYNDTATFTNMMANNKLCYKEILNDPVSNKLVYVGSIPQTGVLATPAKIYVKRGNSSFSFCSVPNAWGGGNCYPRTATIDSQGNIFIAGHWQDPPVAAGIGQYGQQYEFFAKLDSNLNLLWNKIYTSGPFVNKMKMDGNTILICGSAGANIDIDPSPNVYYATGEGSTLLARYDTSFVPIWATRYGRLGSISAKTLTTDHNGNIYVGGEFASIIDLDPGPGFAIYNRDCDSTDWDGGYISKFNSVGAYIRGMGTGKFINEIQYKYPNRIYATGYPMVQIFELAADTTVNTFQVICAGDSIVIGNSVYSQTGIYTNVFLSYTNTDSTVITNLTVNPLPVVIANASDTVLCLGDSVILFGGGALTYSWNNLVVDSVLFSPTGANTYLVTGTDINGCVNTDSIEVIVNSLPAVTANASDTVLCLGDSVLLFGSGALSYTWNNLVTDNIIFSPTGTNNYLVSGTDTNGCVNIDSIEVLVNALPAVSANASDTALCFGDSVILFGSGALSYTWNNLVIDNIIFSPTGANNYLVSGTDTNGCVNIDSIEVLVNSLPTVSANASDTALCFGDSVILFGSGADSYVWNNLVIDSMIFSPITTNNYLVSGTDTNGCVNIDSITVLVNALPTVVANASDTSVCIGNPVILFGTGADSFSWTNLVIDSVAFYPIDTAMYIVTGIDSNGCVNHDSILIAANQIPVPILVFSGDTLYCTNVTGVNIYWFKDTIAVDSLTNYYVVTQNGNYEVLVVDTNGCAGADSISMLNVGFLTRNKSDIIQVFPNPTNQDINISFDMNKPGEVELMINDLLGNKIYSSKRKMVTSGKQLLKIDLAQNNLKTGIYFLNILIDGKRHVMKVEYQKQ